MGSPLPRLRWGLVGASDIAATEFLPALRRTGQSVTAVMSRSSTHATAYAAEHGIDACTDDLHVLLDRPDIDAVYVSSVNELHAEQVMAAARAGKHVMSEKPLAESVSLGRVAVQACERARVVLAVNHHLPASGAHTLVRDMLIGGAIGDPLAVSIRHATMLAERHRTWRLAARPGAGVAMDLTCHDAAVTNALLLFPAREVVALAANQGGWGAGRPDTSIAVVRYGGDVLAHFHDGFASPFTPTLMEVHGTEGSIRVDDAMRAEPGPRVWLRDATGERELPVAERRSPYDLTIEAFCRAVGGEGRPVVDGPAGFRALAVAVAAADAALLGTRQEVARLG